MIYKSQLDTLVDSEMFFYISKRNKKKKSVVVVNIQDPKHKFQILESTFSVIFRKIRQIKL